MTEKKEPDRDPSEELFFRKGITDRTKIQTAEGWRRTLLKVRDEKRKKGKVAPKK